MKQIEKGIPLPEYKYGVNVELVSTMEIGDSIFVKTASEAASLTTALRRVGFQGTSKKLADGGYRVWRLR